MRFKIEDKEYDWDSAVLTVEEAMFLKDKTGMGLLQWNEGLTARDGYAEAALIYLAKKRSGEAIRWQDLAGINLATLVILNDRDEDKGDDESEAKTERPNPTSSSGKTRRRGTSATS